MDDKFSNHVKSVFDNYEDGTADQGWAELLKKHPEGRIGPVKPQKVVPMHLWLGAVAASLVLICFLLFFAKEQPAGDLRVTKVDGTAAPETKANQPERPMAATDQNNRNKTGQKDTPEVPSIHVASRQSDRIKGTTNASLVATTGPVQQVATHTEVGPVSASTPAEQSIDQQKQGIKQVPAENPVIAFKPEEGKKQEKLSDIEAFLEQEAKNATRLASNEKKSKPLTSFDIYAGTFLNYFENNPAKLNAGFGVNANVKISKKVYLSVGAGVSENTIAYENSLPSGSVEALTSSFPLSSPAQGLNNTFGKPGNANSANGAAGAVAPPMPNVTFASKTSGPSTDVSVNAILLNLDIPIALKFYAGKSDRFYLLTGINSNSYINQRYMQSYSTFNYVSNTTEKNEQEVEGSRLNGFDFANSAIFAVGVSQDLSKSTTLTFEPFYRPSLKGLGDKNIRLNTIGVNLKLNVGRNK